MRSDEENEAYPRAMPPLRYDGINDVKKKLTHLDAFCNTDVSHEIIEPYLNKVYASASVYVLRRIVQITNVLMLFVRCAGHSM